MMPGERNTPPGPDATGGQDAAVVFATRVGKVIFALATQAVLAHALLPQGRGSYALCVAFATALAALFTPGAQAGAQHFIMTRQATVSEAVNSALAICLIGGGVAIALAVPLVRSETAFFRKAETHAFHLALLLIPLVAFSVAFARATGMSGVAAWLPQRDDAFAWRAFRTLPRRVRS